MTNTRLSVRLLTIVNKLDSNQLTYLLGLLCIYDERGYPAGLPFLSRKTGYLLSSELVVVSVSFSLVLSLEP